MSTFKPIVADLTTEEDYADKVICDVDISAHLLITLTSDERVQQLEDEGGQEFDDFGDLIQEDPLIEDDRPYSFSSEFSLRDSLTEATEGRYGEDLLTMWHGWKSEAEASDVLPKRIEEAAKRAANQLDYDLKTNHFHNRPAALRHFVRALLNQPNGIEIVTQEVAAGDYPIVDTLKFLGQLRQKD